MIDRLEQDKRFWCGLGCTIVGLGACVILLLVGLIIFNWLNRKPETNVTLAAPGQIAPEVPFTIELQIENLTDKPQMLDSIEISPDYLAGVRIDGSEPPFVEMIDRPVSQDQAYLFQHPLQPGQVLTVKLSAVAIEQGEFVGEVDVCMDGLIRCLSYGVQTVVME